MPRIRIRANQPWWTIDWRGLIEYRDLFRFLIRRDFLAVYAQSLLGPFWYVLQPLAITVVFNVVFGHIAGMATDGVPSFVFFSCGMTIWTYFQSCLNEVAGTFVGNAHLFGKVYFPRLIVPLATVVKNFIQLALNMLIFLAFYAYFVTRPQTTVHPTAWLAAVPLLILQTAMAGMGAGLWLASLTAKYRDLRFALTFLSQLWMFATPVVWSAATVSDRWRWLILANPMASVVVFARLAFLGTGTADLVLFTTGFVSSLLLFVTGLLAFNRVQRTFIDIV